MSLNYKKGRAKGTVINSVVYSIYFMQILKFQQTLVSYFIATFKYCRLVLIVQIHIMRQSRSPRNRSQHRGTSPPLFVDSFSRHQHVCFRVRVHVHLHIHGFFMSMSMSMSRFMSISKSMSMSISLSVSSPCLCPRQYASACACAFLCSCPCSCTCSCCMRMSMDINMTQR